MLRNTNDLQGYAIGATDGLIGHLKDFYFDDEKWVIRYLIVDTGTWLSSRQVLISPMAIGTPNWSDEVLPASMTKEQIRSSPDIDTNKPVSRQHEIEYSSYYTYPYYWGGSGLWGGEMGPNMIMPGYEGQRAGPHPVRTPEEMAQEQARSLAREGLDTHLRSCKAVMGYHIHASDGDIGHVQSLLIDQETWAVRYLVVDTSNWWLGHKVLIVPQWVQNIDWSDSKVSVNLSRQAVQDAPIYDPSVALGRQSEDDYFKHYGRANYWDN